MYNTAFILFFHLLTIKVADFFTTVLPSSLLDQVRLSGRATKQRQRVERLVDGQEGSSSLPSKPNIK